MRDGKFQVFGTKDGLLSDVAFQILEDSRENLWVSCNKGIYRVSKRDLDDFAAGKIPRIPCVSYGRADGMKSPECNGGTQPAGWKTRDGRLWFPTIRGVVTLDPQHLETNEVPPPVLVEGVLVDGRPLSASTSEASPRDDALPGSAGEAREGRAGEAPPGSDRFEFHFTALSFLAPDRVRFQYFLEGYDKRWNDLEGGRERVAVYTNLPPGKYTFRVKACNNDGLWNEAGAAFPFRLRPQFHQTLLFSLLVALALLLLGGTLYHFAGIAMENLRIGRSLARYHSRQVIEKLRTTKGAGGTLVASERRRLTILFSDITGFSDFSDRNEPEVVDRIINAYLTEMAALLEAQSGTVARFMGDGIMAFFGAPAEMEPAEQALRAVTASVAMQRRMGELGRKWLDQGHDHALKMRVGISQDYATVGNFGSKDLMEYTALGSAVNLAARLETGCTPGRILVSFAIYMATKERFPYSAPEEREFKGFSGALHVAELDPEISE
jgi:class 3 adenylate cyclase